MARFMFVGDTHGNLSFASKATKLAQAANIDTIYQLGDFGIWDHVPAGENFLNTLNENAGNRGVDWFFVAGNHENYNSLQEYAEACTLDDGFVPIRDNIHWVGRANVWYDQGILFGALGGAVSIDRAYRTLNESWWPQEFTSLNDLMLFDNLVEAAGRPLDVMISHDAPLSLPTWPGFFKGDPLSNANRAIMNEAGKVARPARWFHGHYHKELTYEFQPYHPEGGTEVYGLDCDSQWTTGGNNVAIWDSETDEVTFHAVGD